jgi:geranylgeranylglycerol-phosphate geranylgeranyltransferase
MTRSARVAVPAGRTRAIAELTRAGTVVAGVFLCLVGARLAEGPVDVRSLVWATTCVALLIAFAQVVNDIIDVEVDRLQGRPRPLVRGDLTVRSASLLAIVLGATGLFAGLLAGSSLFFASIVILLASWAYSARWKGTAGFGNLVVALLSSCPVTFGAAAAAGHVSGRVLASQAVVFVFMTAFEVLKTGRDRDGDDAAGLTTIATKLGVPATLRVAGLLCVGFAVVAIGPALLSDHWVAYIVVMATAVFLTELAAWRLLSSDGAATDLSTALLLLQVAWFPGIVSMAFL